MKMKFERTFDYENWETREMGVRIIANEEQEAIAEALILLTNQMRKCKDDPFSVEQKELLHD
jgi:hypothetical protein